jgi:succinyl-diaminopimelate desuccinylase
MSEVIALAQALIACPTVTPEDGGCQDLIAARLARAGFTVEPMRFGEVHNLWARRGRAAPLLCLAGHTDVVPTGPVERWRTAPFDPVIEDGMLHGRGSADMKGALAAMVVAAERFVAARPSHAGSLAFLITGDEEGPSVDGTVKVVERLLARGERIDWCVLGEPSSQQVLGDTLRHGRRGSLSARLTVHGVQGHVAYPDRAVNAIHMALPALAELAATRWDDGIGDASEAGFPPTTFQLSNFNAGHGTNNVIPGSAEVRFNLRYCTAQTIETLSTRIEEVLRRHGVRYSIEWKDAGRPFLTQGRTLIDATRAAVREVTGVEPRLDTGGGTSDGRFIAPTGAEVIELGPVNATIHQVDERVSVDDLERLATVYERLIARLLDG